MNYPTILNIRYYTTCEQNVATARFKASVAYTIEKEPLCHNLNNQGEYPK